MARKKYDFDLIVIGSGAGGSVAADTVARAGKRVAIIEADILGGECPNYGCIPSKAFLHASQTYDVARTAKNYGLRMATMGYNYPSVRSFKDQAIRRTGAHNIEKYYRSIGISLFRGKAHFLSPNEISVNRRHLSGAKFLIATGARADIPSIPGLDDTKYLTSRTALELTRPPKSLFVIGAGATGCELTELFATFGTKVSLADIAPRILPNEDEETSASLEQFLRNERSVKVLTKAKVIGLATDGPMTKVTYLRGGEQHVTKVEKVLITTSKKPNTDLGLENAGVDYSHKGIEVNEYLQTSVSHIYASGDVLGHYMYTHTGVYESRIVANNILRRHKVSPDYSAVPRVTYTTPEVASVGMSEADCLRRDLDIKKAIAPLNMIARSNITNNRDGFCKVITDKSGTLIGGTIVGPHAGEAIHELTIAIAHGLSASDVASTLHAFPSWSEVVRVACSKIKAKA